MSQSIDKRNHYRVLTTDPNSDFGPVQKALHSLDKTAVLQTQKGYLLVHSNLRLGDVFKALQAADIDREVVPDR